MNTHLNQCEQWNLANIDDSWHPIIEQALTQLPADYVSKLFTDDKWLPGHQALFNAFSIPLDEVNVILLGESPYPRTQSANGYAFWDAAVGDLWSETGLTKTVNRATSLRNLIKMLLIAADLLTIDNVTQAAIAAVDKTPLINSLDELFQRLLDHGFLLLNTSLVLSEQPVRYDAKAWQPFINHILQEIARVNTKTTLLLWGKVAATIDNMPSGQYFTKLIAEHPYNVSFISNQAILNFFKPLNLLIK